MILEQLKLKNFWSYPEAELNFFYKTPVVVLGTKEDNSSNGAGKSCLFEAILWGLFGKTSKNIYSDAVVNATATKNCVVTLVGTHNGKAFKIVRYRKHDQYLNSIKFYIDGLNVSATTNLETQKYIEKYLQIDFNTFQYTCFFNPTNTKTFCSLGSTEQKSIFEEILDLNKWSTLHDKLSELIKESDKKSFQIEIELNMLQKERKGLLKDLEDILNLKNEHKRGIQKFPNTSASIKKYEKQLTTAKKDLDEFSSKSIMFKEKWRATENEIKAVTSKLAKADKKICYACNQPLVTNDVITSLRTTLEKLEEHTYKEEFLLAEKERVKKASEVEALSSHVNTLKEDINTYKIKTARIKTLKKDLYSLHLKLKKNKEKIAENTEKLTKEVKEKRKYKQAQNVTSNKGIKTYLINTVLPLLNSTCNKYLNHFTDGEFTVKFSVDKNARLNVQIKRFFSGGYESCSAGEMRRIDVALLLGLLEVTSAFKTTPNFLVLDEVFDCLDEIGVDKAIELLYNLERDNIFVITHNLNFANKFQESLMINKNKEGASWINDA